MPRVYNKSKKVELTPPQKWFTPKEAASLCGVPAEKLYPYHYPLITQ